MIINCSRKIIVVCLLLVLFFGCAFSKSEFELENDNFAKSSSIVVDPVNYETEVVYTDDLLYGKERIKSEGVVGYKIDGTDTFLVNPVNEVKEVGKGPIDMVFGSTTGYGADCDGCSGNVACSVSYGTHNLIRDGIYFDDSKYGSVRIVAADNTLFSCGTILEIDNGNTDPFYAIVLDTGSAMRNAWRNSGSILIDIAFSYENSIGVGSATNKSGNVKFKVYRYGW